KPLDFVSLLNEKDRERCEAISGYLAWQLSNSDEVRLFRAQSIKGVTFLAFLQNQPSETSHPQAFISGNSLEKQSLSFLRNSYPELYQAYLELYGQTVLSKKELIERIKDYEPLSVREDDFGIAIGSQVWWVRLEPDSIFEAVRGLAVKLTRR